MENIENKEKIYCIFNQEKEDINVKIGEVFKIYLKDYIKPEEKPDNNQETH